MCIRYPSNEDSECNIATQRYKKTPLKQGCSKVFATS